MFEQHINSASQQIASLRQFFRSQRRLDGNSRSARAHGGPGAHQSAASGFSATLDGTWDDTQWSETRQDLHDD
ncbi:MAG: hypothetical protein OEY03_09200 [Rhizobacter sp.]|nr:hypothetical protein [Rhizobacter sp.]